MTAADIREGIAKDCAACPVARALSRATGRPWYVTGGLAFTDDDPCVRLPRSARRAVFAFDTGSSVAPFEFDAEV